MTADDQAYVRKYDSLCVALISADHITVYIPHPVKVH